MLRETIEHSEHMNELAAALAEAQGAMKNPGVDSDNPYLSTRYASLAAVRDACVPHLSAVGIALTQLVAADADSIESTTALWHKSGQYLKTTLRLPVVALPRRRGEDAPQGGTLTAQAFGVAIAYARRYQLMAVCNLAGEQDDDGESQYGRRDSSPGTGKLATAGGATRPPSTAAVSTQHGRSSAVTDVMTSMKPPHEESTGGVTPSEQAKAGPAPSLLTEIGTTLTQVCKPMGAGFYKAITHQAFGCDSTKLPQQSDETLLSGIETFRYLTSELRKEKGKPELHPDKWVAMKMRGSVNSAGYDPLSEFPWSVLKEHQANPLLPTPLLEDIALHLLAQTTVPQQGSADLEEKAEHLAGRIMEWLDSVAEANTATA